MKNSDARILSKIKDPKVISLDVSTDQYRKQQLERVRLYIQEGYTESQAISIVNGDARPSRVTLRKNRARRKRLIVTPIIASVLALCGVGIYAYTVKPEATEAIQAEGEPREMGLNGDELILLVGSDERPEVDKGDGTSSDIPGIRTDMLALIAMPQDGSRAVVTSIPRDLNVYRPKCDSYDYKKGKVDRGSQIPAEYNVKINSVYEVGGAQCLVKTINNVTGQKITQYAQIDFDTFSSIIDELGGVELNVKTPVIDEILGTIVAQPGKITLDGKKALDYARARHVIGSSMSDFDRIQRQQQVMNAVLKKASSSLSPTDLTRLVTNVLPKLRVDNISVSDAVSIWKKASRLPRENVFMSTIPTLDSETENYNILYDEKQVRDYFSGITSERPISGQVAQGDGFLSQTVSMVGKEVTLVYHEKNASVKNEIESYLVKNGVIVNPVKNNYFDSETTTIHVTEKNKNDSASMMYVFQNGVVSTEKVNVGAKEENAVIVVGRKFTPSYFPPENLKVFIPRGEHKVENTIPVILD